MGQTTGQFMPVNRPFAPVAVLTTGRMSTWGQHHIKGDVYVLSSIKLSAQRARLSRRKHDDMTRYSGFVIQLSICRTS